MPTVTIVSSALKSHLSSIHQISLSQCYAAISWKPKGVEERSKKYSIAKSLDVLKKCDANQLNYIEERVTFVDKEVDHSRIQCKTTCPFCPAEDSVMSDAFPSPIGTHSLSPPIDAIEILSQCNVLQPEELTLFSARVGVSAITLEDHITTSTAPRYFIFTHNQIRYIGKLGNTDCSSFAGSGILSLNPNTGRVVPLYGDIKRINLSHSVPTSCTFVRLELPVDSALLISIDEVDEEEVISDADIDQQTATNTAANSIALNNQSFGMDGRVTDLVGSHTSDATSEYTIDGEDDRHVSGGFEFVSRDDGMFDELRMSLCFKDGMSEDAWSNRVKAIAQLTSAGVLSRSEARRILL
jgi:hypothetical protein